MKFAIWGQCILTFLFCWPLPTIGLADQLTQVVTDAHQNLRTLQKNMGPPTAQCDSQKWPEAIETSTLIMEFTHPTCALNVDLGFSVLNNDPEVARTLKFLETNKGYHVTIARTNGEESDIPVNGLRLHMFIWTGKARVDAGFEKGPWLASKCILALKANFSGRLLSRESDGHLVDRSGVIRVLRELCIDEGPDDRLPKFPNMSAQEYKETEPKYKKSVLKDGLEKIRRLPACIQTRH